MPAVTIEVRATRAAKRQNKKIAAAYPLFASQFAVTADSQIERLLHQDEANLAYGERLEASNHRAWERAKVRKGVAQDFLPADKFADYEARYQRIYGHRSYDYAGHAAADWWWCALRNNDVPWCWDHCPNAVYHTTDWHRRTRLCPTCHKPLAPPEPEPTSPTQIRLEL